MTFWNDSPSSLVQPHQLVVHADGRAAGRQAEHALAPFGLAGANERRDLRGDRLARLARVAEHAAGNLFESLAAVVRDGSANSASGVVARDAESTHRVELRFKSCS